MQSALVVTAKEPYVETSELHFIFPIFNIFRFLKNSDQNTVSNPNRLVILFSEISTLSYFISFVPVQYYACYAIKLIPHTTSADTSKEKCSLLQVVGQLVNIWYPVCRKYVLYYVVLPSTVYNDEIKNLLFHLFNFNVNTK